MYGKDYDAAFSRALLDWFAVSRRALPWRETYAPYPTWIAEIMMQQTQMERGVDYFLRWMQQFPNIASVAEAPEEQLLLAWEGLGYYRRVRNIQAAARMIMNSHNGQFPEELTAIRALPGIGEYTAAAIASTAFQQDVACVDGNVERLLSRVFDLNMPLRQGAGKKVVHDLAGRLLPLGHARDFNQAMMELGALICRKKSVCERCPVIKFCVAYRLGIVDERPIPNKKLPVTQAVVVAGVLRLGKRVFMQRRMEDDKVWAGLWEFPGGMVEEGESPERAIVREFQEETEFEVEIVRPLGIIRHTYTRYRLTLHCFDLRLSKTYGAQYGKQMLPEPVLHEASDWRWASGKEVQSLPLPAAHRKLAEQCGFAAAPPKELLR